MKKLVKHLVKALMPSAVFTRIKRLLEVRSCYMSQAGQDFWVYGEAFNEKQNGYFVDVGAHDGVFLSNSLLLEKRYRWNGLCIEANPDTFASLRRNRTAICCNVCLDSQVRIVEFATKGVMGGIVSESTDNKRGTAGNESIQLNTTTLSRVLSENNAPSVIDYLSIDVEGAEELVLGQFDFGLYTFQCITIERPSAFLRRRFSENGYVLIKDIPGLDCFYIHASFQDEYISNLYRFYNKKQIALRWS